MFSMVTGGIVDQNSDRQREFPPSVMMLIGPRPSADRQRSERENRQADNRNDQACCAKSPPGNRQISSPAECTGNHAFSATLETAEPQEHLMVAVVSSLIGAPGSYARICGSFSSCWMLSRNVDRGGFWPFH